MEDLMEAEAAAAAAAEDVRLVRPALAAFLQNSVKLDRRELLILVVPPAFLVDETDDKDFPELLELELLNSSCDDLVRWNGMGEGIGVGMGEGNSLIGDKHFEKLNPGTSSVMVGAPLLIDEFSVNMASPLHS